MSKIYHTMADPSQRQELAEAPAGDIVAVIGPRASITGDTICDPQHPILLERISFAQSVVTCTIEPESSADKDKLEKVLTLLAREDPTFSWRDDPETGQKLISGMGLLHIEIKVRRIEDDFRLKVRVGKPRVSYRETLRRPITVEGECVRHAGATNLFAKVRVHFEPHKGSQPVEVVSQVPEETLPPEFIAAAEQGIRNGLESGLVGFPVMNVRATLLGGERHEELSNETAFLQAGSDAVSKALRDNITLLEPMMKLEVTVPEEFLGPVAADLNARRAEITQVRAPEKSKLRVVDAIVALSRMFDYAGTVRSLSQGRASSSLEPFEYRPAPDEVLHQLLHPEEFY